MQEVSLDSSHAIGTPRADVLMAQRREIDIPPANARHFRQPAIHQQNMAWLVLRLTYRIVEQFFIGNDFATARSGISPRQSAPV